MKKCIVLFAFVGYVYSQQVLDGSKEDFAAVFGTPSTDDNTNEYGPLVTEKGLSGFPTKTGESNKGIFHTQVFNGNDEKRMTGEPELVVIGSNGERRVVPGEFGTETKDQVEENDVLQKTDGDGTQQNAGGFGVQQNVGDEGVQENAGGVGVQENTGGFGVQENAGGSGIPQEGGSDNRPNGGPWGHGPDCEGPHDHYHNGHHGHHGWNHHGPHGQHGPHGPHGARGPHGSHGPHGPHGPHRSHGPQDNYGPESHNHESDEQTDMQKGSPLPL